MAQAGLHGLAGLLVRRWKPGRHWLPLGIVLGNLAPDLDNVAVAVATITGGSTEGLHRTFTHSLFTAAAIVLLGYLAANMSKRRRWADLGLGLGVGIGMHILFDLLIWFNGVELLWPLPTMVNFWAQVEPPEWWSQLMMPAEFLAFAAYFLLLAMIARETESAAEYQGRLRLWTALQGLLFLVFTILVYVMESGFTTIYGAVYLLSLFLALGVTIRLRKALEVSAIPVESPAPG